MWPTWEFDAVNYMYILMFFIFVFMFKNGYFEAFPRSFLKEIKEKKMLIGIGMVIIIVVIFTLDKNTALYFKENMGKNRVLDNVANFGNNLGNGKYLYSFLVFTAMVVLLVREKAVKIFYISLGSGLITAFLNQVLKILIVRQRPYESYNPFLIFAHKKAIMEGKYLTAIYDSTYYSMPSGHTITVAGIFLVFALYVKNKYLKVVFFGIPLLTAFGRVYIQKHWLSDVLFAYLVGFICASAFYNLNKNK